MKKQYAALWLFVLLLSLSLIVVLMRGSNPREPVAATATPAPTDAPEALVIAPTRRLPTVAPPPTATGLPSPMPTMTSFVVTVAPPGLRVFQVSDSQSSGTMLSTYCASFGSPVAMSITDWTTGATVSVSDEAIVQIPLGWDARDSIWQGYQSARPFNQPDDTSERWKISLFLADESERWIEIDQSATTPALDYAYSFQKIVPFAQPNGQHFGIHPCRAFTIAADQVQNFLSVVAQYQDAIRYPPLISGDDSRWKQGSIRPVGAFADLRSIPSDDYNDPIGDINQAVTLWYALDPSWGHWAQIKLGSVQGWVDTDLVQITPAS